MDDLQGLDESLEAYMKVRELMSNNVVTIENTASCHDAAVRMTRQRVRHLPIVAHDGTLCGIVTDRDLRHYLFEPETFRQIGAVKVEMLLKTMPVSRVMSEPVITVDADAPLEIACQRMIDKKLGSLPVMEGQRLAGIVTETDLLRRVVGADACCAEVAEIVVSYP